MCVVTGANTGLGFETARAHAEHGASVVLAVRSSDKGVGTVARIRAAAPNVDAHIQHLDLCPLDSIRCAAQPVRDSADRIDPLVNCAGGHVHAPSADRRRVRTSVRHQPFRPLHADPAAARPAPGVEGSRTATVSSIGHRMLSRIDFDDLPRPVGNSVTIGWAIRERIQANTRLQSAAPIHNVGTAATHHHMLSSIRQPEVNHYRQLRRSVRT